MIFMFILLSIAQTNQWQPRIVNAKHFHRIDYCQESVLLIIISTAGDGKLLCSFGVIAKKFC